MKRTTSVLAVLLALLTALNVTAFAAGGSGGGNNPLTIDSVKVGEDDLTAESKISGNSEIVLTFSNNVTEDTVWEGNLVLIRVEDSENNAVSATVSKGTEKTQISVTLGGLAKGSYALYAGADIKAKNGNTLGEEKSYPFSVKGEGSGTGGGNNPLSLVSVKANDADLEGAELEASGKIVITFDRGMTENQAANFEQIGIYDKDGKKVEGVTFSDFTKDDDGNSYTDLSYENLTGGEYTLKLGKDLKANNGKTLGEDKTINFTVKAEDEPEEKTILDKIVDFFKMIIDFLKNALNKVLSLVGVTL
ncbi:MAG: Ig-like domain-containing protein [Clostridia bacterium]|nr:Ig-like domain-containing protein [Clostridia bacterium]